MIMIRPVQCRAGFSLMEINMAVFVMAVGILGMVALFPLGLREGSQGRADLKQSMFADHALNQLTGLLSQTNITWSQWKALNHKAWPVAVTLPSHGGREDRWDMASLPFNESQWVADLQGAWKTGTTSLDLSGEDAQCRIFFRLVGDPDLNTRSPSLRVMGIGIRTTDQKVKNYNQYTNNALYYTEVTFQGEPF